MKDGQPDDDFNHSSSDHQRISPSIRISGRHLIDPRTGETIQLRGFSVSSHSKLPSITSESKAAEASDSQITFVGNPLRLDEADHYLNQITSWGYNLIRLVVCWESIEHSGPGQYDLDYINYLVRLVEICQTHQLRVIVDCHQDVWSRFSGGSGAPGWTLELVGFRLDSLVETRSAVLYDKPDLDSPNLGLWPTGYQKLASATMFTLFFGGDTFAPDRKLSRKLHAVWAEDSSGFDQELISVQRFLQDCICEAFGKLADALARFDCVIGFEPMNEPHRGFIDLHSPYRWNPITDLHLQDCPSFLQSVALADGHPQRVDIYKRFWPTPSIKTGKRLFRPRRRAWKDSMDCIWKEHGVWEWDEVKGEARMLKKDYFKVDPKTGQKFDFYERSLFEFVCKFSERVQKLRPDWLISFGPVPNELYPKWEIDKRPKNLIAGPHFYDLFSLFHKSFGFLTLDVQAICSTNAFWKWFYFGHSGANKNYAGQIGRIVESVYKNLGEVPILIGETGVCMDMNGGRSFKDGNFYWQEAQMDSILSGIEKHLISFVVWNFDPYNDNEFGDHWNGENFSLISRSKIKKSCKGSLNCHLLDNRTEELKEEGGFSEPRILKSIRRPFVRKIRGGIPIKHLYNLRETRFEFEFEETLEKVRGKRSKEEERFRCEIYWPRFESEAENQGVEDEGSNSIEIEISDGDYSFDESKQTIIWKSEDKDFEESKEDLIEKNQDKLEAKAAIHWIKISKDMNLSKSFKESFKTDRRVGPKIHPKFDKRKQIGGGIFRFYDHFIKERKVLNVSYGTYFGFIGLVVGLILIRKF